MTERNDETVIDVQVVAGVKAGEATREATPLGLLQSDRAREIDPLRPLLPRQKAAVENRLANPLASKMEVGLAAGYSVTTVRNSKEKGIATPDKIRRYEAEQRANGVPSLVELGNQGRIAMQEAMTDPDTPPVQRGLVGEKAVRLHREFGEDEPRGDSDAWRWLLMRTLRRGFYAGIRSARLHGPDAATAILASVEARHEHQYRRPSQVQLVVTAAFTPAKRED